MRTPGPVRRASFRPGPTPAPFPSLLRPRERIRTAEGEGKAPLSPDGLADAVRDSKTPDGPILRLTPKTWTEFTASLR
ncbi:DUF397 domain-containing protein [Streptomyces sp. CoH27]|uniref:DUF397 domain-containing protein n=1 Tax=Streptomyces sp. CoH27 TaxID=2875763 RepID=UPI001CD1F49D|nr:DUF397 domain-containing protein [Streptomyces sp. CoH27]